MKLALGTAQFGLPYGIANHVGQVARSEVKAILEFATAQGLDTVDTAIAYGDSETALGEAGTKEMRLITKLPAMDPSVTNVKKWVEEHVLQSLQRLRQPQLYGLLLHRSSMLSGPNGVAIAEALKSVKKQGMVQKIGVSIYSSNELESAMQACPLDLVQAPFNVMDRGLHTSGWLDRLRDAGIEVHVRSVFLQGLLLLQRNALPAYFMPWNRNFTIWHDWLRDHAISPIQACLGFAQSFPGIDRLVVGVDSLTQLQQLINASRARSDVVWPQVACADESLINPSFWKKL